MTRPVLVATPSGLTPAVAIVPADVAAEVLVALDRLDREVTP